MACQVTQDNKPFALKLAYVLAQLRCGITGGVKQLERDRKEKVKGLMVHFSSSVAEVFCVPLLKHRVSQWCVFTQHAEFLEEVLSLSALVSCMSLAASELFVPMASVLQCSNVHSAACALLPKTSSEPLWGKYNFTSVTHKSQMQERRIKGISTCLQLDL